KYFDWEPSIDATGKTAHDGWDAVRGGFRIDTKSSGPNSLTVQGDLYTSNYNETLTIPSLNPPYSNTFSNDGDYAGGNPVIRERIRIGRIQRRNRESFVVITCENQCP